jgi:hypothetical protein
MADAGIKAIVFDESMWEGIRRELLEAANNCQAARETQVASCAKKLTKAKYGIFQRFMAGARARTDIADKEKMVVVGAMATVYFRFVEEFQNSLVYRHVEDLSNQVSRHYNDKAPAIREDDRLYEALYYIVGYVLQAGKKNGTRRSGGNNKSEIGSALVLLAENAAYDSSADAADELLNSDLPFGMTMRTEQFNNLTYPKRQVFDCFVSIENVFSCCLTGENFCAYGSFLLRKICTALVNTDALTAVVASLLPEGTGEEIVRQVVMFLVRTYGRLRGKDALRKMNSALKRKGTSQSTRSTLAVQSAMAVSKNNKKRKRSSEEAASVEDTEGAELVETHVDTGEIDSVLQELEEEDENDEDAGTKISEEEEPDSN